MVEAQKKNFKNVISIELDTALFEAARERFKKDKNVTILQGDSGKVLPGVMEQITAPAIFWLDGHYSEGVTAKGAKECPIFEELGAIFSAAPLHHILLIDDARCFTGMRDYPTFEELKKYILNKNTKYQIEIKHDIIRCTF